MTVVSSDLQGDLPALAQRARWEVIKTVTSNKAGHIGGPLSMMDLLVSLYFGELRIRPEEPDWPDRDRFILSKGHAAIGLYAVLALRGYLDLDELSTFDKGDSRLQGHPDVTRLPGLDASTGSLGQGLSAGVGMALGARLAEKDFHTFVLMGDGEIQEGMVWEAVQVAARYKLTNLTAIVDRNGLQQFGLPSTAETTLTDRGDRRDPWFGVDLVRGLPGLRLAGDRDQRSRLRPDRPGLPAGPGRRPARAADGAAGAHRQGQGPVAGRGPAHLAQHRPDPGGLRTGPPGARAGRDRLPRRLPRRLRRAPRRRQRSSTNGARS